MDAKQVWEYWQGRAKSDSSARSTTNDVYLREIEFRVLKDLLAELRPGRVADIGCGDARTTLRLAAAFPSIRFFGGDYSDAMIRNALRNIRKAGVDNLEVGLCDVTKPLGLGSVALVYTTRCIINVPTWEQQQEAIRNIWTALSPGGHYVMIENFVEGHEAFNRLRDAYRLPRIPIREHNLFLERSKLERAIGDKFDVVREVNISSTYYLVTRIVYSRICRDQGVEPDYMDDHHRYAAELPFTGEFGPVRMLCLRKR